jgi:hypothetical protein
MEACIRRGRRGVTKVGPRVLTVAGLAIVLLLATACQDWTQFMGNAALNGNASGENIIGITNVTSLSDVWTLPITAGAPTTGVTTSGGTLFTTSSSSLVAADAYGQTNCSGSPKICQPLWTAPLLSGPGGTSQPLVSNHVVYESSEGASTGQLAAYDANGVTNCSGSPKVCQPLWTAPARSTSGPNIDGGTLFIVDHATQALQAYDANGVTNCSGSPTVCLPLWTAPVASNSVPSIADGKVYVATNSGASPAVVVFDEAGTTNCSGSPKVCQPLFTGALPANTSGSVDVSGGVAYVNPGKLVALSASGTTNCSGSPLVCQPVWTGETGSGDDTPAVAGGRVYTDGGPVPGVFWAYDAAGITNCTGTPKVCTSLFNGPLATVVGRSAPLVTNGIVFLGGQAWDAAGVVDCPPGPPFCSPVWHTSFVGAASPTVSNGTLYVRDGSGTVHAFQLR